MTSIRLTPALARSASAIAITACLMLPGMAFAQDSAATAQAQASEPGAQQDPAAEDVVITGIRASLDRAIDIKRNSSGVVDAISAEDIGKFPDTNLAESLQRIPGVSINRVNGEGSEVTARGFGAAFNLVTLNGRTMPAANVVAVGGDQSVDFGRATSRAFDFSNLASEGVSRLEVYKTGRAAIPSGGIGATVNVVTRRPLDGSESGIRGSIGAKAVIDSSVDRGNKVTPEVSGLLSWSNELDTVGVSLFGSYQRRDSAAASATSNAWNIMRGSTFLAPGTYVRTDGTTQVTNAPAADDLIAVPNDSRYHFSESERERINFSGVLQFRPVDGLTITGDALWVQNKSNEARSDQTNWFNRPFNQVRFDGNDVVSTTEFLQETIAGVKDTGFEQQYRATKDKLESYGLNLAWDATDTFSVKLDGHISTARSDPDAPNGTSATLVSIGAPVIASHSVDFSGEIPVQSIVINDALRGNNNGQLDLGDLGSQVARTNASSQRQRIKEARLEMGWDAGGGSRFDFGGSYIDSEMTSARIQTQQTLGDWGITYPGDVNSLAPGLVEQFCLTCKFDHFDPGATGASLVAFRGNAVDLYNALSPAYAADSNPVLAGVQAGRPIDVTGNDYDRVHEKTWSVFGQITWEGEIGGMKTNMVAGVRYEKTDVASYARVVPPSAIRWTADNDFSRILSFTTAPVERNGTGSYSNFLPAFDFSIEPVENLKGRLSFSRTLARPEYGNLFVSETANAPGRPIAVGGEATGSTGNPNLQPLLSDNLDLSLEWYFAPSSYVSAGFFYKNVRNFVGSGQSRGNLFGLRDPSSGAAGSRSGTARTALGGIGANLSDVNLFTMTALIIQNNGNVGAATTQFQANRGPSGDLNQGFVDSVLAAVDITADANDPLFNFVITQPINNREAKIHGFELAGSYFFGQTGFGVAGSYTIVRGDVHIDPGADPAIDQFALLGLSDSFNITAIYDKGGISARVAYNWRDKYLSATNRDGSNRNPVFVAPFGTLDVNVSWDITDNIALSFEGINLTSEAVRTYGRTETNLYFAQELKPRYLLGARFRF
ncbi:TonB-dependent receptor [Sphingomonas naasensis]|uniref:TonB-dependent receptor n=1 Tax=Sphingomonas naasensis TaxID=1344951 RepID=A0A4S1WS98_9SPHN|nr:TonB-dependent receptor [Sphingomonas naasensis]NIJ19053.1 TonB-dependent receptor [Sphingomonas naasensis]TGX46251.1 TonB-dependent receptor [Sphingomonas naasensis]